MQILLTSLILWFRWIFGIRRFTFRPISVLKLTIRPRLHLNFSSMSSDRLTDLLGRGRSCMARLFDLQILRMFRDSEGLHVLFTKTFIMLIWFS
jgi:hypothetical protein